MARKQIREYDSKRLVKEHLKRLAGIDLQICSAQTKYSYLDVLGRTVVVLEKKNVVPEHLSPFQVHYTFKPVFMLAEPLMLREDVAQLHQFILHAALDIVQDLAWTTSAMFSFICFGTLSDDGTELATNNKNLDENDIH